jgi:hypothetical protein
VEHTREVYVPAEGVVAVNDVLECSGRRMYVQRWPLSPDAVVDRIEPDAAWILCGDVSMILRLATSSRHDARILRGSESPVGGWWSVALERIRPSSIVEFSVEGAGRVELLTVLAIGPAGEFPSVQIESAGVFSVGARSWSLGSTG